MKDYQLYLEKITNALSRAGISYPAPIFTDYEGMWSYVEGLSSFLELNAQLQKSGEGVVLMGLEESTTFKSYWNSEFYQEFQERKLLESKISSKSNLYDLETDSEEIGVLESAEFPLQTDESDHKTNGLENSLVVGSVVGSVIDSSLVSGTDSAELEAPSSLEGYDSSNIVFIDNDFDEDEESEELEDGLRYDEDGFVIEYDDDSKNECVTEVAPPSLEGYDSSNIVFVDDDSNDEENESSDEDELQYDEDGFVILDDDDEEGGESPDSGEYTYDEFGNKYDKDGFIVLDDDDEEEYSDEDDLEEESENESDDEYTYDEYGNKFDKDGFIVEDEEEEEPSEGISYEPDGSYYDEYGNHFDADGFLIEDEEEDVDEEDNSDVSDDQSNTLPDGSYYDEYGNHFDADGFLIEDEDEEVEEDNIPTSTQRVSTPSQPDIPVHREVVTPPPKPKIIMPKEVQTADKIISLFGGMESKLRKKVQDVKKPKN